MKKLVSAIVIAAVSVAGCTPVMQGQGSPSEVAGFTRSGSMPAEANMVDVLFLALMVPHHQQAVDMSDMLLADPAISPETKDLAQRIRTTQVAEIEYMNSLANEWDQQELMRSHADHLSMGMISQQQMEELKNSTGAGMEKLYLRLMYRHHEGAIKELGNLVTNGGYQPLKNLAQHMKDQQLAEMDEMVGLLGEKPV